MVGAVEAWDGQHQVAYGKCAWERAAEMGDYLHCWHVERTLGLVDGRARKRYEKKNKGFQDAWRTERSVLALLLWRTALKYDVLVDRVLLTDTLSRTEQNLFAAELPTAPFGITPVPNSTIDLNVFERSSQWLTDLGHNYEKPDVPIVPSIGHLVRDLRATPGWTFGDWAGTLDRARNHIDLARTFSTTVGAGDRAAIKRAGLDQEPSYDYPAATEPFDDLHPSWLQRAYRLITLAATLRTVTTAAPPGGHFVSEVLAVAFTSNADAYEALAETVQELEQERAAQALVPDETPTPYGDWQTQTVSSAMWKQVEALESLARDLVSFLSQLETAA
ncbi:hypothetical protein ACGFW5_01260 [Streptomyces sp. NPDC048416]|uniref:hypothetical protein n=1 Tax=Streptomyces sp. NPDC048416 TaxID=3365546 RepID=UPI00371E9D5C